VIDKSYHGEKNNAVGMAMGDKILALAGGWVYNTFKIRGGSPESRRIRHGQRI
jgi:hypothetical protein